MAKNQSSFKYLYSTVFKNGGDLSQIPDKVKKTPIRCYVKESHPYFLVTDDYFYVPCYFTKKAVDSFKASNKVSITDLRSKVIKIDNWSLELAKVKSEDVFTSYGGVELKLIVNDFTLSNDKSVSLNRHPVNIYRDNEMKNIINQYIHSAQSSAITSGLKSESLPDISKFGKGSVSAGVVKFASGESFSQFGFKDGKTSVLSSNDLLKSSGKAADKSVKPKVLGRSLKSKSIKKSNTSGIAAKIASFTPGKKSNSKKSVTGKGPKALATPGASSSANATTDFKSMKAFKSMVAMHKKSKSSKN